MNAALFPRALLMMFLAVAFPAASFAHWGVSVTVGFAPPELPVYAQPPCPAPGYIWTPGYWAYSNENEDYFWVPGTWVVAPSPGLLWTPGYWAVVDDDYVWYDGYWAPHVGFYGGINYGFGYFGVGFVGGHWRDRDFYYNSTVTNVSNVNVTNVYNTSVINNHFYGSRASFNGSDGVHARPTPMELVAAHEPHRGFTPPQRLQAQSARSVPGLLASVNHGHPNIAATARAGLFQGPNAEPVRDATSASSTANLHSTGATNHSYSSGLAHHPIRESTRQPLSARPWNPPMTSRSDRSAWIPPSTNAQHSVSSTPVLTNLNYRRPEPHAPAEPWSRPGSYRPAPVTPAYRATPSYTPPPRARQATMRNESYGMPPRQTFAQAPRAESVSRNAPPARVSGPITTQERRRP